MRSVALTIVLVVLLPLIPEAQEDHFGECLTRGFRKQIEELEERIKRARETPIAEHVTKPTETPEQRLDRMRLELRRLQPVIREVYRCGRWIAE